MRLESEEMSKQNRQLSLHPLKFDEAVADILKVKPEPRGPKHQKAKEVSPRAENPHTPRRKPQG
jgi:hypothetical protein